MFGLGLQAIERSASAAARCAVRCRQLLGGALYMRRRGNASHSRTSLPLRCFLDVGHRVRRLAVSLTVIYLNLAD